MFVHIKCANAHPRTHTRTHTHSQTHIHTHLHTQNTLTVHAAQRLTRCTSRTRTNAQGFTHLNTWRPHNTLQHTATHCNILQQEFGHLITMVAATYIPRSQITGFRQLDQGSFGMIYSAAYDGSSVAVKQCSSDGSQVYFTVELYFPAKPKLYTTK